MSVRFPKIGSIVQRPDGSYSVGAIPGIGGPFETAAEYFRAWAQARKFPFKEDLIRERTPPHLVDEIIASIYGFPGKLSDFTKRHSFKSGPFPLIHPDLYTSNVLIDSQCNILGVIDWENSFVGAWEMVEFPKNITLVPPVMDGSSYREDESERDCRLEQKRYVEVVKEAEGARQMDGKLSDALGDENSQNLGQALWLWADGRIGYYSRVLELFD
ncbi:hypothetical protein UVI_02064280 [Ustilaginoidea virens]|uniref:Aminoglycoside phosphotransferase domain-containing protein n=1 Tax=Ustilaginoidea virens TaxID=1159556 RepID=A0A1B5L7S6_USTVR|nr:hypothetical protein UVI_02064280 [Ustilaginoidea virens]